MSLLRDMIWELQLSDRSAAAVGSVCCRIGPQSDAMDPRIHGARTHWIRGFMAFQPHRRAPNRDADGADVT